MTDVKTSNDDALSPRGCQAAVARISKSGCEIRMTLRSQRGLHTLDVRTYADINGCRVMFATKRAITVPVDDLPAFVDAVLAAEREAICRGLLSDFRRSAA